MVKTRGDHRGVAGVEVDEAFEFDTVWAPLGDVDGAGVMDDDEWFNEVHDGHEKVWGEEQQQYKDVCSALIDVGPVKRLELGAAACKVKPATPSSSSFRRSSARDSTCSGASTARRAGTPLQLHHTPRSSIGSRGSRGSSIGSAGNSSFGARSGSAPSSAKLQTKKACGIAKKSPASRAALSSSSSSSSAAAKTSLSAAKSPAASAKSSAAAIKLSSSAAASKSASSAAASKSASSAAASKSASSAAASKSASSAAAILGTSRSKRTSPAPPSPPPAQSKADLQALLREHNRRVRRAQLGLA